MAPLGGDWGEGKEGREGVREVGSVPEREKRDYMKIVVSEGMREREIVREKDTVSEDSNSVCVCMKKRYK